MSLLPLDLTEVVYEELIAGDRANDGLLHASSHITGSLRHAQLSVAGAPTIPQALIRHVPLWTGTMWHRYLEDRLKALGVPAMMEVNLTPWMPAGWGGTADLFLWNPGLKAFVLVDIKTTKGDGLKWIRRDGAKPEHVHQISTYWHAAKKAGFPLVKECGVFYLPMTDTRDRGEVIEPILCEVTPLPWRDLHATLKSRHAAVQAYIDSLPFGHDPNVPLPVEDYLTEALAPVQERIQAIRKSRASGLLEVILKPHWTAMFCEYPLELCDCSTQGETKIGHYEADGTYVPRDGYADIPPTVAPSY